jgi:hypothetical protein
MSENKRNVRIVLAGLILVLLLAAGTAIALAQTPTATPLPAAGAPADNPTVSASAAVTSTTSLTSTTSVTSTTPPPAIPHPIASQAQCNACHATGVGGAPKEPANHQGRPENLCVACHISASGEKVALPTLPAEASTEFCLQCHGPYEDLIARTVDKLDVNGVKANPHRYVPHTSKNITGCDACHSVHELPVTATTQILTPDTSTLSCFNSSCHHQQDFTPCTQCHKDMQ